MGISQGRVGAWVHEIMVWAGISFRVFPVTAPVSSLSGAGLLSGDARLELFGFFKGDFGLGESARLYARALIDSGVPVSLHNADLDVAHSMTDAMLATTPAITSSKRPCIFFINPDYLRQAVINAGREMSGGKVFAFWYWELERVPEHWRDALVGIDGVFVASRFVEKAIKSFAGEVPVVRVPMPIYPNQASSLGRAEFGLDAEAFVFMTALDFNSTSKRKNPGAVIKAFLHAFPRGDEPVQLVVKTSYGSSYSEELIALVELANGDRRVLIRDAILERRDLAALLNSIDVFVSLHRSEGFGLVLAEAMAAAKPVIATAWSGNLDYMTEENSCLVRFCMVPVQRGDYPNGQGQRWAEPDFKHAAEWMRRLEADRRLAARIGERARRSISEQFAPAKAADALAAAVLGPFAADATQSRTAETE